MILESIIALILILAAVLMNVLVIRPRKILKFYQKQLSEMNYKSLIKPFNFFYNGFDGEPRRDKKIGDPYRTYRTVYPHYDIVLSNVLNIPVIELLHVDFIKDFYALDKHYDYPKIHYFMNPYKRFYGDMSIGMSQGDVWKQRRSILNKLFTFQFVKLQIPNIVAIADRCISEMQQSNKITETPEGKQLEPFLYEELSLHIFSQVLFFLSLGLKQRIQLQGVEVSEYMAETVKIIANNQNGSITSFFGNWFYDCEFRHIDKVINQRIKILKKWGYDIITTKIKEAEKQLEQKKQNFVGDTIIKAILQYKKVHGLADDNSYVSVEYLFSQICGLFVAGTDTTSNFWNMMIAYMAKYPEVESKVRQQIDMYMKEDDYSFDNLKKMVYIDALEKEVTRVYGPGNLIFPRIANKNNYINGLAIKKGTLVSVNPIGNEYSEKYFKNPEQFRPERWLNGECENLPPYVLLGFNAGARTCIGKQFALLQSKIALIKFLKRYKTFAIPNKNFKMNYNLTLCAEYFKTKLVINEDPSMDKKTN